MAVSVQLSLVHGLLIRLTEDERAEALCSALRVSARAQNRKQTSLSELMMLIEFAPLIFGTAGLLAIFLFSQWQSTSKQKDRPKAILHSVIEIDQSAIGMLLRRRYVPKRMSATPMIIIAQAAADPFGPLGRVVLERQSRQLVCRICGDRTELWELRRLFHNRQ